ncbi:MAG: hypothetical protein R6U94_06575 [Nitriliruptoraceae bacterium]
MDELLQRLKGMGLDDAKAGEVIQTVRAFLEEKLPDPIAAKLDDVLSGNPETMDSLLGKLPTDALPKDLGGKLKGLLGG